MEEPTLEQKALQQFDRLVSKGNLLWEANNPRYISTKPFAFQFRVSPSLATKPILSRNDPGRKEDRRAFSDNDPDFFLEHVGPHHSLILNKFCVVRPQYIIHTNTFVPQSDHLTQEDLAAAWSVLSRLDSPHMIIFNCGAESGSSQGHKHLQVLPRPPKNEFEFWPETFGISEDTTTVPEIPFRHAVKRLPSSPTSTQLFEIYTELLTKAKVSEAPAHNVILVNEWMLVVPRVSSKLVPGGLMANASVMVGMVWATTEEDFKAWVEFGVERLGEFAVVDKRT